MKVLTFGVFDYFHFGHLKLFQRCKALGDFLIVAVQNENEILKNKPHAKIFYSTAQRIELVSSVVYVDKVLVYNQVADDIKKIEFDILCVGGDQTHAGFQSAIEWCKQHGKKVVFLDRTPNISSSDIKNNLK